MINEKKCRLVLKGLPLETTEDDLKKIFKHSVGYQFIHKENQKIKTGFVQFKNLEDSKKANFKNLVVEIHGKKVKVEYCLPKDRYNTKRDEKELIKKEKIDAFKKEKDENPKKKVKLSKQALKDEKNRMRKGQSTKSKTHTCESEMCESKGETHVIKEGDKDYTSGFNKKDWKEAMKNHKDETRKDYKEINKNHKETISLNKNRNSVISKNKGHEIIKNNKESVFQKTKEERTFYLSNLSYKETSETIIELMGKYGKINSIKLERNADKIFTGICKIEYETFKKTIFTDNITSNGRLVEIKRKLNKKVEISNTRLFISNINKNLDQKKIQEIFKKVNLNPVVNIKNTGKRNRNGGYCFLDFKTESKAERFMNLKEELKELGDFKVEKSKEKFN